MRAEKATRAQILVGLAKRFGTPLVVIDEPQLRAQMQRFRKAFESPRWRCQVVYAAKALALKAIARIAAEEGLGFDACSEGELQTALRAGVAGKQCILHGCAKTERELELAVRSNIQYVVVDNREELATLSRIAEAAHVTIPVLLRLNVGIAVPTKSEIQTSAPQSKFGFPIQDGQALTAVSELSRNTSLAFRGVHCHIGSQITDLGAYSESIKVLTDFVRTLEREHSVLCDTINVGGGLGLAENDDSPTPEAWAQVIFKALDRAFPDARRLPNIMVEPGRAIVARAGSTLYSIAVHKTLANGTEALIVDGGMSDNPRPALYEATYAVTLASRPHAPADGRFTIFGRHCETDLLFKDVALPQPQIGDILEVHNTGAYTYSMASNYNRFARPAVVLVGEEEPRVIARREPLERLLDLDLDNALPGAR